MAVIRPYEPKDKENVRNVCLATGPANAYEPKERIFLLACFCDYYIENEPEHCFVVENAAGEAAGYIFCAENYKSYRRVFKKEYVKRAEAAGLIKGIYALFTGVPLWFFAQKYPAHLHIDILPELQRQGAGTALMNALFEKLKAGNVPGVMLVCGANNQKGRGFYNKYGFHKLVECFGFVAMGVRFDRC